MNVDVMKADGKGKATAVEIADAVIDREFNEGLVHQVVTAYLAGARQGSRAQLTRSQVRGGGRKPFRQKGTGRARAGTTRGPIWRGGGVTFPSTQQDFAQKVNRKMYRAAMRSILSELNRQGRLLVLEDLSIAAPRTKELAARLKAMDVDNALLLTEAEDRNLALAARNLPGIQADTANSVDPVSLVGFERIVLSVAALKKLEDRLA